MVHCILPCSLVGPPSCPHSSWLPRRRSLVCVSRRWQRVFLSEPSLWRWFQVEGHHDAAPAAQSVRLQQRLALLQRVAQHVESFKWLAPSAGLATFLLELHPGLLSHLHLRASAQDLFSAAGPALRRLTGVTSLVLRSQEEAAAIAALTTVGSSLHRLHLDDAQLKLTPAGLSSIVKLTQLSDLGLGASQWPTPTLGPLTRLSRLKQLAVTNYGRDALQPPDPASFPGGLESFDYTSYHQPFQASVHLGAGLLHVAVRCTAAFCGKPCWWVCWILPY